MNRPVKAVRSIYLFGMDDRLLVEALRERDADAPAAVYDAYADRLYAYCWFLLRNRDAAQVALRDTFISANAHVSRLRDPERFAPWLYAVARLECARRLPPRDRPPDVPIARHDQEDVDKRIVAWHAVQALRPDFREILELRIRHRLTMPDLAAVLGVPLKDAQSTLESAHHELEASLTAEMLAHQGPYGCAERAALLRERHGVLAHDLNGRLMRHAGECSACEAHIPRTVSAPKVYDLLPDADLPPELRVRVMSCFLDPELVGYRLFVAGRVTEFTPDGFPVQGIHPTRSSWASTPGGRWWLRCFRRRRPLMEEAGFRGHAVRVAVVLAVMAVLAGGGIASIYGLLDTGRDSADTVAGPHPTAVPGLSQHPVPGRPPADRPQSTGYLNAAPVSATFPLGATAPSAPATALSASPPVSADPPAGSVTGGALAVSPLFLDLAGGSDGSVTLRAEGGPVTWQAKTRGAMSVHPSSGRLAAGQSVTVRVHASRRPNSKGAGTITFQPGGSQVDVTWRPDAPDPDGPDPTPSRSASADPSTPPATERPGDTPSPHTPTQPGSSQPPSTSPEQPPSQPPPSNDEPGTLPSTEPSAPGSPSASSASSGTSPASGS